MYKKRLMTDKTLSNRHRLYAFKIVDQSIVDSELWYTVRVNRHDCAKWIRDSKSEWQYEHAYMGPVGTLFDIHEKLYTLLSLRWA